MAADKRAVFLASRCEEANSTTKKANKRVIKSAYDTNQRSCLTGSSTLARRRLASPPLCQCVAPVAVPLARVAQKRSFGACFQSREDSDLPKWKSLLPESFRESDL